MKGTEIMMPYKGNTKGGGVLYTVSSGSVTGGNWDGYMPIVGATDPSGGVAPLHQTELKCVLPEFTGTIRKIILRLWVTQYSNHKTGMNNMNYRYAVCSSNANRELYRVNGSVTDPNQLGAGLFTCPYDDSVGNANGSYRTLQLDCSGAHSGDTVYVYLWTNQGYNGSYGADNWHVSHKPPITQGWPIKYYPHYVSVITE